MPALCCLGRLGAAEPDGQQSSGQSSGDSVPDGQSFAPKRQYFIAPRVGRAGVVGPPATIWSALEEASFQSPGQIQPHRGFPGPLRSSLLFLVGNRRLRSPAGGLLPQARIGRRAAPSGLLPQPRVGRRSDPATPADSMFAQSDASGGADDDEQEVALAATSDNLALSEALEPLLNG